jgi:hypothetical protein
MISMTGAPSLRRACQPVLLTALALAFLGGCGSRKHPVVGKVVFKDGKPLDGGMVVLSPLDPDNHVGARGYIKPNGTFELSSEKPQDGVREGRYQVLVKPPSRGKGEDDPQSNLPVIDPRYTRFETSGLEVEVKPDKNEVTIEVDRPAPKNGRP